mmetsp:Transcript_3554/g.5861  ORF Transcript_3554/g.5861 Transcript_3554/m.5861 type:complete len:333 (+) Transcript_3554:49-1047(+)
MLNIRHFRSLARSKSLATSQLGAFFLPCRGLKDATETEIDVSSHVHFRKSSRPHPLKAKAPTQVFEEVLGDHTGRQQNHIWTHDELVEKMSTLYRHEPVTVSDHVMNKLMYGLYHTFNFMTGYTNDDPSVKAMEWRLILLESIAGVPGFVAAGFRHLRSLRKLERDHGWIATLLEEAENERMHLLLCLHTFEATYLTRTMVVAAQCVMTPFLMAVYMVHPKSMHRFVGYLEETACHTYVNTIKHIETPGTKLHAGWAHLPAPAMAIGYYYVGRFSEVYDEANHRDVNHTFASMKSDDPNPFLSEHAANAAFAWRLNMTGEPAWESSPKAPKE